MTRAATDMDFANNEAAQIMYLDIHNQVKIQLQECPWGTDIMTCLQ